MLVLLLTAAVWLGLVFIVVEGTLSYIVSEYNYLKAGNQFGVIGVLGALLIAGLWAGLIFSGATFINYLIAQ